MVLACAFLLLRKRLQATLGRRRVEAEVCCGVCRLWPVWKRPVSPSGAWSPWQS